jgi:hypothetical protein
MNRSTVWLAFAASSMILATLLAAYAWLVTSARLTHASDARRDDVIAGFQRLDDAGAIDWDRVGSALQPARNPGSTSHDRLKTEIYRMLTDPIARSSNSDRQTTAHLAMVLAGLGLFSSTIVVAHIRSARTSPTSVDRSTCS